MILKILLVVGVIAFVYFLFIKKTPKDINNKKGSNESKNADEMVECANCGVYAPLSESILSGGKYYCSNECLKKA